MPITGRLQEILVKVISGKTNAEIAKETGLAKQTVKNCIGTLFNRTGCNNRVELTLKALFGFMLGEDEIRSMVMRHPDVGRISRRRKRKVTGKSYGGAANEQQG